MRARSYRVRHGSVGEWATNLRAAGEHDLVDARLHQRRARVSEAVDDLHQVLGEALLHQDRLDDALVVLGAVRCEFGHLATHGTGAGDDDGDGDAARRT